MVCEDLRTWLGAGAPEKGQCPCRFCREIEAAGHVCIEILCRERIHMAVVIVGWAHRQDFQLILDSPIL